MNGKKYLVYLDILGFEDRAREIAEKTGFEEDVIRQNYLSEPLEPDIMSFIGYNIVYIQ